jgi:hypothetical protein
MPLLVNDTSDAHKHISPPQPLHAMHNEGWAMWWAKISQQSMHDTQMDALLAVALPLSWRPLDWQLTAC